MSLLVGHGHVFAHNYTVGRIQDEMALVIQRDNLRMANELVHMQAAITASLSQKGQGPFKRLVKSLTGA